MTIYITPVFLSQTVVYNYSTFVGDNGIFSKIYFDRFGENLKLIKSKLRGLQKITRVDNLKKEKDEQC